ncbi:retinoic acid early-inducible protein 1-epsilon-like [Peromyscus eremicus]|uniref:retinoic acid early-inducible protein 1-epsilon-like n=1 Tax=Peromyscus eremicus TaxID=42410 RepID=UPI0027DB4C4F|nr:retinoic acid early-inducible protein 1-epsilon-like [Peromyscus eremicus]
MAQNKDPDNDGHLDWRLLFLPFCPSEGFSMSSGCLRTMSPVAFCSHFVPHLHVSLTDTHTLNCNVTVRVRPTSGQPCCEGRCSLDGEPFLQYDNDSKATPLGDLGKLVYATRMWTELERELVSLGHEFRKKLAEIKQRITNFSGHLTLQAFVLSQLEQGQIIATFLKFNISGKYCILLNTMNMSWTLICLEAGYIMNEWKNDEELAKYLETLMKNFCHWLKELLKLPWERTRSTATAPDITQLPSTVNITQLPSTINITQLPSTTKFQYEKVFIPLGLIFIIPSVICIWMCMERKSQGVRNLQMPMNCSMNCYKPQRRERPMEPSGEFPNQATKMLSQEDEPQDMKVKAFTKPDISITPSKSQETSQRGRRDVSEHCFPAGTWLMNIQQL